MDTLCERWEFKHLWFLGSMIGVNARAAMAAQPSLIGTCSYRGVEVLCSDNRPWRKLLQWIIDRNKLHYEGSSEGFPTLTLVSCLLTHTFFYVTGQL
ncbi:Uncharacterized protein HZ326_4643 [Fusarium oxysporum f. sp. albedinis]|nr:Uncharacterized protein HZ326_4643 [Fusarium oxysporum f. sp. albedinis]